MENNCIQLFPIAFNCFQFKLFDMNRLQQKFQDKKENLLTVYFTAGYPELEDTATIIKELEASGVDIIEVECRSAILWPTDQQFRQAV